MPSLEAYNKERRSVSGEYLHIKRCDSRRGGKAGPADSLAVQIWLTGSCFLVASDKTCQIISMWLLLQRHFRYVAVRPGLRNSVRTHRRWFSRFQNPTVEVVERWSREGLQIGLVRVL